MSNDPNPARSFYMRCATNMRLVDNMWFNMLPFLIRAVVDVTGPEKVPICTSINMSKKMVELCFTQISCTLNIHFLMVVLVGEIPNIYIKNGCLTHHSHPLCLGFGSTLVT